MSERDACAHRTAPSQAQVCSDGDPARGLSLELDWTPLPCAGGDAPKKPRTGDRGQLVRVGSRLKVRILWPGPDDEAETAEPPGPQRLRRERAVAQGATACCGHDDVTHVDAAGRELGANVGDRGTLTIHPHEQPAGSLDEHHVNVVATR